MLRLQPLDRNYTSFWVVDDTFTIGSAAKNQMRISHIEVAPTHAVVRVESEQLYIEPYSADTKVSVNSKRITSITKVNVGDVIALSDIQIELVNLSSARDMLVKKPSFESVIEDVDFAVEDPAQEIEQEEPNGIVWKLQASNPNIKPHTVTVTAGVDIKVGRDEVNDIVLEGSHISRRHAEFFMYDEQLIVRDFHSANGTFVNGEQVIEKKVYIGDQIRFDTVVYNVISGKVASLAEVENSNDNTQFRPALTDADLFNGGDNTIKQLSSVEFEDNTLTNIEGITEPYLEPAKLAAFEYHEQENQQTKQEEVVNILPDESAVFVEEATEEDEIPAIYNILLFLIVFLIICAVAGIVFFVFVQ